MRSIVILLLLAAGRALAAAEAPPLAVQAAAWAARFGHGAVATAEKRDGKWAFAMAGEPFAAGHDAVPAEQVIFEIGSISKVFTGLLLADAVETGKLGLDDTLAQRLPVTFADPVTGAVTLEQLATHTSCPPRLPNKVVNAQLSFHRDATGKVDGLTLHQNGLDIPASRDSGPVPHVEFPDAATLAEYAGVYDFGDFRPGSTISVQATPEVLLVQLTGQPAFPVFSVGKDRFEYDVVVAALTFERDAAGKVVAVVLHQNGMDIKAPKQGE